MTLDAWNMIIRLEGMGQLDPMCQGCKEHYAWIKAHGSLPFAPSHKASTWCESGKRPHCSCDRCF